jgi:flagellar basal-body rod protein FlgB
VDTSSLALLKGISSRMDYLSTHQRVIADNIANANTPGYQAREMKQVDFSQLVARLSGAARSGPKVAAPSVQIPAAIARFGGGGPGAAGSMRDKTVFETKPNGNSVVLEEQLMSMADAQMQYQTMINLYRRQTNMLRTALGRGR